MDQMVLQTQQWLNKTYGDKPGFGSVITDGNTGWDTINGLIRALQIELGITATANNFGADTTRKFNERYPHGVKQQDDSDESKSNVYSIIQGALWCKGYSTSNNITQHFYSGTGRAVKELKNDMGIGGDSTVTIDVMKALLSMQQFVLLNRYGGTGVVRIIQQTVNRTYKDYTGIIPCDGLYGREMNTALIQILQSLEGYSPDDATGNFGHGTRRNLKTISRQNASSYGKWVWLAKAVLNCIRYDCLQNENWDDDFAEQLTKFQKDYKLPVSGALDVNTWMSLLTSKGNPDRKAKACDTRFEITSELLNTLKRDGYEIVGRYLTGGSFKEIREGELKRIVDGGLKYFPIFQENGRNLSDFTYQKGLEHGKKASEAALSKGVPATVIYFAVDMDIYDYQIDSNIIPYFKGINETIDSRYSVGIYASRNVCTRISNVGLSVSSFVSDMSTGFSGNLGFPIPKNWNYDQFHEISGYGGKWDLDKVAYNGKIPACNSVLSSQKYQQDETQFIKWVTTTEKECLKAFEGIFNPLIAYRFAVGQYILEYLRKPEYWGDKYFGLWRLYTPEPNIDKNDMESRSVCHAVCSKQPSIKDKVSTIDIAHMAATALGYICWGIPENKGDYSLGDLGGWSLDLLQMFGNYRRVAKDQDLSEWLKEHLGSKTDGQGFGYDDVVADADAYLIVSSMKKDNSDTRFSKSISQLYQHSKCERIKMFYQERFNSSKDNVISAFKKLADGIDFGPLKNVNKDLLKQAAKTDVLPTVTEAKILGQMYAEFMAS